LKLIQHLATKGKKKISELSSPKISTVHSVKAGKIDLNDDNGIILEMTYAGQDPKQAKLKWDIIIDFKEFPDLFDRLQKLRDRFDDPSKLPEHTEPWA
jgi:hypothetical protein